MLDMPEKRVQVNTLAYICPASAPKKKLITLSTGQSSHSLHYPHLGQICHFKMDRYHLSHRLFYFFDNFCSF